MEPDAPALNELLGELQAGPTKPLRVVTDRASRGSSRQSNIVDASPRGLVPALVQGLRELFAVQRQQQERHIDKTLEFVMGWMEAVGQLELELQRWRSDGLKLKLGSMRQSSPGTEECVSHERRVSRESLNSEASSMRQRSRLRDRLANGATTVLRESNTSSVVQMGQIQPHNGSLLQTGQMHSNDAVHEIDKIDVDPASSSMPLVVATGGKRKKTRRHGERGPAQPQPHQEPDSPTSPGFTSGSLTPQPDSPPAPLSPRVPSQRSRRGSPAPPLSRASSLMGLIEEEADDEHGGSRGVCFSSDEQILPMELSPQGSFEESSGEDGEFEVLVVWSTAPKMKQMGTKMMLHRKRTDASMVIHSRLLNDFVDDHKRPWQIHPSSPKRAAWDLSSFLLVLYDCIVIPLQFFDFPENVFQIGMRWFSRLFWTVDIGMSFLTGYLRPDASSEMAPGRIARRYVASWFPLDSSIIMMDWLELILNTASIADFGQASRAFRVLRLIRLLRFLRVRDALRGVVFGRIRSERLLIIARMGQQMAALILWSHLIACIWYGIGKSDDNPNNWVNQYFVSSDPLGWRYLCSLHWSLALLTGGMDEIRAFNSGERAFTITMYVVAFVLAAAFVSYLTSSMTQLQMIASRQVVQVAALRRFLAENGISDSLANRVQRNALHALSESVRFMPEDGVELLGHVSGPLRIELHFAMYSPVFAEHPFLSVYTDRCPEVMRKVCHTATVMAIFHDGDVIFSAGEIPQQPKMYFVTMGTLKYVALSGECRVVQPGDWLSEPALWTYWMHRGELATTSSSCRLCMLDANQFQQICSQFQHSDFDPRDYAASFIEAMNRNSAIVTDLPAAPADESRKLNGMRRHSKLVSHGTMSGSLGLTRVWKPVVAPLGRRTSISSMGSSLASVHPLAPVTGC